MADDDWYSGNTAKELMMFVHYQLEQLPYIVGNSRRISLR